MYGKDDFVKQTLLIYKGFLNTEYLHTESEVVSTLISKIIEEADLKRKIFFLFLEIIANKYRQANEFMAKNLAPIF